MWTSTRPRRLRHQFRLRVSILATIQWNATDVNFQSSYRPSRSMAAGKIYCSANYILYRLKMESSILLNGFPIFCSCRHTDAVHDLGISQSMQFFHH